MPGEKGDQASPEWPQPRRRWRETYVVSAHSRTNQLNMSCASFSDQPFDRLRVSDRISYQLSATARRNGVSPSVAPKLMRHSDIRLTMNR